MSSACSNVSKDYYLNINIDGIDQTPRRRLMAFDFLRKNVNETTEGTIGAKRLLELDDTMVANKLLYVEELVKQQLAAKEYLALVNIETQKNISDLAYGESYALRVQRLRSAGEFAKAKIESERRIALAELNESKKLAKLRRILYEGYDPETEAEIEQLAVEKAVAVEQLAAEKTILVELELNASIAALEDRGTRYLLINMSGNLLKAEEEEEEEEEEVGNISITGTGFFNYLGSLVNRITKLFVQDIDASGNINASNYTLNGTTIDDWSDVAGSDTDTHVAGDNIYLTNSSTTMYFNETKLNITIDARDSDTTYSHLSNFTDDLGNRGYTSLSNFTNDKDFINLTQAQDFNETDLINAVNTTANIDSLGFLNKSGTNANQNLNINQYNLTTIGTGFFGFLGSLTNRITKLFVQDIDFTGDINGTGNIITTKNITANHFIGNGSQLIGISSGGNPFDQSLNTIDSPSFQNVTLNGSIGIGTDNPFNGWSALIDKGIHILNQYPILGLEATGGEKWGLASAITGFYIYNFDDNKIAMEINNSRNVKFYEDVNMNKNLNVNDNVTADYFIGDGSQLTGISSGGNPFDQSLNTTDSPSFQNVTANSFSTGDGDLKWKIFTGTLDADDTTTFSHGIPIVKLAGANCILHDGGTIFSIYDSGINITNSIEIQYAYRAYINGDNLVMDKVGTSLQGNAYRCIIWYIS